MDDLPSDILMNIFVQYLEDDEDPFQPRSHTPTVSPWSTASDPVLLGQVCRYWRSIALLNTSLWSRIYIIDPQRSQFKRTKLWLDRAGSHPLDLGIIHFSPRHDWDEAASTDIMRIFITKLPYWRKIKFQIPCSTIRELATITASSQQLSSLEVASVGAMPPKFGESLTPNNQALLRAIWRTLHSSPRLHEVCWHGIFDTLPDHAPWGQIRSIPIIDLTVPDILRVLVSCSKLELFVINVIPTKFSISQPLTPALIIHDSLTHLEISGSTIDQRVLLASILLPSLQHLEINQSDDSNNHVEAFPIIHKFLCQSRCQLQMFHYTDSSASAGHALVRLLKSSAFDTLQYFGLDRNGISDEVLHILSQKNPDGSHQFMPTLAEIHLSKCQSTDGLLSNMITSRFNAFLKYARLQKSFEDPPPFDQVQLENLFPDHNQSERYIGWFAGF